VGEIKKPTLDNRLRAQVNKRLALNMLIQGGAAYTFVHAPNFARSELEMISPGLTRYYCQYAILGLLNYSRGENVLGFGLPNRWLGWSSKPQKAMESFPFFVKHAHRLSIESARELFRLGRHHRLFNCIGILTLQFYWRTLRLSIYERPHRKNLEKLAMRTVSEILEIPFDRLIGKIAYKTAFGNLRLPETPLGRAVIQGAAGFGGVEERDGTLYVVAKAWNFPLLVHELIKGTLELVSLHALGHLSEDCYRQVCEAADHIEYEAWMLQSGPALWKRFLQVCPPDSNAATALMCVARWSCDENEQFMFELCEDQVAATNRLKRAVDAL
jgi:hypothetical protein